MSDPAVLTFITKILCAGGGGVDLKELPQHVELPEEQLKQILSEAGKERFLLCQQDLSSKVLAVTSLHLCLRDECDGCQSLHLCKNYVKRRCYRPRSGRGACKYSHDIFSEQNRKVLKDHELYGLNEDELRVLLLQNDPFLLPDVCFPYNKENCPQKEDCKKLHVCRYFIRGNCRFLRCKRSHDLLRPNTLQLLLGEGVDDKIAWNIQTICDHKTAELAKEVGPQKERPSNPTAATGGEKWKPRARIQGEHSLSSKQAFPPSVFTNLRPLQGFSPFGATILTPEDVSANQRTGEKVVLNQARTLHPVSTRFTLNDDSDDDETPVIRAFKAVRVDAFSSNVPGPVKPSAAAAGLHQQPSSGFSSAAPVDSSSSTVPGPVKPSAGVKAPFKPPQSEEKKKSDEICVFYVWQFCKHKNNCDMIHYHLPYRWQEYTGTNWNDMTLMEEIEKAYCDPSITSYQNINFKTMMSYVNAVRRQSTPSSVTKPAKFVFTTKWLWYWKNDKDQWIEYGKQDGEHQGSTLTSDDLENLFLSQPDGSFQFQAGSRVYEINFKDMIQKNLYYLTQREVRRRPKYVSREDVKNKKGHSSHSDRSSASIPDPIYPREWDKSALPPIGYKAIELAKTSSEYTTIESLFHKTMSEFVIHSIRRIQNPSLWQVFQWQKEQMKKKKGGQDVEEKLLFHGTGSSNVEAICSDNFDWRICGTNGTVYGKGSYFARDAQYSHNYCQPNAERSTMFVARVLVGDFVVGHHSYSRPPARASAVTSYYDSCVDKAIDPSIFVIFEKHQIYPAYMISYSKDKKCILA